MKHLKSFIENRLNFHMNIEKLRVIDIDLKCVATLKSLLAINVAKSLSTLHYALSTLSLSLSSWLFLSRTVLPTLQIWKFSLSFANYCITFCDNKQVKGGKKEGGRQFCGTSANWMQNQKVSCNFNSTSYHSLSLFLSTTTSLPSSSFFPSSPSSLFPSPHCVPSFLSPPTTAVPHHSPSCRRCLQTFDEICAIAQCRLQWRYLTQLPHCAASLYPPSSPAPLPLPRRALT